MHELNPKQVAAPIPNDWDARNHVQTLVLLGATAFGIYLSHRMTKPFLSPLGWAPALAAFFAPCQGWLVKQIRTFTMVLRNLDRSNHDPHAKTRP